MNKEEQILKDLADLISANTIFCTKEVLTSDEAARYLGISKSYLYKLTMRQQIPHFKPMGKMCYFNRVELESWLQSNRVATVDECQRPIAERKREVKIKIKKLTSLAVPPWKAHLTDAGFDLYATSKTYDEAGNVVYGCGLAFEIPEGYMGLVFPRSSNARTQLILSNTVGVIDAGYRGEVTAKFKSIAPLHEREYQIGERFAQIIFLPIPNVELEIVDELSDSERGTGGYGSSGL